MDVGSFIARIPFLELTDKFVTDFLRSQESNGKPVLLYGEIAPVLKIFEGKVQAELEQRGRENLVAFTYSNYYVKNNRDKFYFIDVGFFTREYRQEFF